MRDFEFLHQVTPTLKTLYLGATRSKSPALAPLDRFRSLRTLYIEGHEKDIDILRDLNQLEDLTLRSITTPDVSYLTPLTKLWSLDVKLGVTWAAEPFPSIATAYTIFPLCRSRCGFRGMAISVPN